MEESRLTYLEYMSKPSGFLRRMFGWARRNLGFLPAVQTICNIGESVLDAFDIQKINYDVTITSKEQIIIDDWDLKEFTPFYANLLMSLENISKNTLSDNDKVKFINQMLLKIDAISQYYRNVATIGLSENALQFRRTYVENSLDAVRKYFETVDFLQNYERIDISDNTANVDLKPLVISMNTDFTSSLYKVSESAEDLTPSAQLQSQNQPTLTIQTSPTGEPVVAVANKNNVVKVIAFSILTYFGLKYAFKE